MRRERYVRLIIRADGTCTVDAVNFPDATCRQATGQITDALAGRVLADHDKPEARNRPLTVDRQVEAAR